MNNKLTALMLSIASIPAVSMAGDVTVSGFLSVGGGKVSDAYPLEGGETGAATSNHGYSEDKWTFDNDTIFGMQVSAQISDRVTTTGQFIAKGAEDFELTAEWAYISFQASDNLKLRIGRFVVPFYLYSDFRNVGYALPWIRAPQAVYSLAFNSTNGVDFIWTPSLGIFDTTIQGYTGSNKFKAPALSDADTETSNAFGLAITLNRDWFTFRAATHQADVSFDGTDIVINPSGLTLAGFADNIDTFDAVAAGSGFDLDLADNADLLRVDDAKFTFDEVAIQVDTGSWLLVLEATKLRSDTFFRGSDRVLAMTGWRFSDYMVHFTYGEADDPVQDMNSDIVSSIQGLPALHPLNVNLAGIRGGLQTMTEFVQRQYTTMAAGLRWDFTPSVAFKFEVEVLDDDKSDKSTLTSFAVQSVF